MHEEQRKNKPMGKGNHMHSQKVTKLYFMIIKENTSGGQTVLFSLLNMLKQSTRKQCNK